MYQKGNVLIIALLLLLTLGAGGYYLYSTGKLDSNPSYPNSNYMLPRDNSAMYPSATATDTSASVSTSNKISLVLTSPLNGVTLKSGVVSIKGKTSPNAEVFVNDASTKADAQGNFTLNLTLDEGSNTVTVTANDADGNVTEQNLSVNVQTFQ